MKPAQIEFEKAVVAFGKNNFAETKKICLKILRKNTGFSDAAHLLALVFKQEDNFLQSKKYYRQCLQINPDQPVVLSNYANLLAQHQHHASAEKYFKRALALDSNHFDAWRNYAQMLIGLDRHAEAAQLIRQAIAIKPDVAGFYTVLGAACSGLEAFDEAVTAYDKAISLSAKNSGDELIAVQNKALCLRNMHKPELAVSCLAAFVNDRTRTPETAYIKACAHYDIGEYTLAEENLLTAIAQNPLYVAAHEALNKLYWEQSEDDKFLRSYKNVDLSHLAAKELVYSYVSQLIQSQQLEIAKETLLAAQQNFGADAGLLHALAVLSKRLHQDDASENYLNGAIKLQPDVARFRIDKANMLILQQQYKAALTQLEHAGKISPLDQEVWAFKGLCWRLLGDEKDLWLNNYDLLVNSSPLPVPNGYDNLEHLIHELKLALEHRHKTNRQPLDQSVQNGTQTVGKLLTSPDKVIQDYRKALSQSVSEYLAQLPDDPSHPFLNRNVRQFVHTGSWSVKLRSGGFHSNHMHPQGWLSNCTYISLPHEIKPNDPAQAGWIKFGETSLQLGNLEHIGKTLCPEAGLRVLFPSYMWHGTVPFASDEYRITVPSDISPKAGTSA